MKVLKFGGKSLANGKGLETVLSIIIDKVKQGQEIAVVVSARDKATDQLESMLERAAGGEDISNECLFPRWFALYPLRRNQTHSTTLARTVRKRS